MPAHRLHDAARCCALVLTAACASLPPATASERCGPDRVIDAHPFDPSTARQLAGRYALTIVADWPSAEGRTARGELDLWAPDSLHPPAILTPLGLTRAGNWPLFGTMHVDGRSVGLMIDGDAASSDTTNPGVRVTQSGMLLFQVVPVADGFATGMQITDVTPAGFQGSWSSWWSRLAPGSRGFTGYFCARRLR